MFDEENLKEEIIDVLLETIILAKRCNVDLNEGVDKKLKALFERHAFKE